MENNANFNRKVVEQKYVTFFFLFRFVRLLSKFINQNIIHAYKPEKGVCSFMIKYECVVLGHLTTLYGVSYMTRWI